MSATGGKECSHCGRTFSKGEHLRRHERLHTLERPFNCTKCVRTFARKDVLKRHLKTHERFPNLPEAKAESPTDIEAPEDLLSTPSTSDITLVEAVPTLQPGSAESVMPDFWPVATQDALEPLPADYIDPPDAGLFSLEGLMASSVDSLFPYFGDILANFPLQLDSSISGQCTPAVIPDLCLPAEPLTDVNSATPTPISPFVTKVMTHREEYERLASLWPKGPEAEVSTDSANVMGAPSGDSTDWSTVREELAGQIVLEPIEPPSSAFLSASLNLYFRHLHNELPFIHRPTFQPQAHNALFLLAMCASGSRFIGTTEALSFSSTVFERINLILQRKWTQKTSSLTDGLDLIRVSMLYQWNALYSGDQRLLGISSGLLGFTLAFARRLGLLEDRGPCNFSKGAQDLPTHDPIALKKIWHEWISAQVARRIVCLLVVLDNYHHAFGRFHQAPPISVVRFPIDMPAHDASFQAADERTWSNLSHLAFQSHPSFLQIIRLMQSEDGVVAIPDGPYDNFILLVYNYILYTYVRLRAASSLPTEPSEYIQEFDLEALRTINKFHTSFKADSPSMSYALEITWHGRSSGFYLNWDHMEFIFGRKGPAYTLKALQNQREDWILSPDARIVLIHCAFILQYCRQLNGNASYELGFFTVGWKAALYIYYYAVSTQLPNRASTLCASSIPISLPSDIDRKILQDAERRKTPSGTSTESLSATDRFIQYGGPCQVLEFGLLSSQSVGAEVLFSIANLLTANANGRPIGLVCAEILRSHALIA